MITLFILLIAMTLKVLWSSDSPLVPTGFGTQSLHFCRRLGQNPELNVKMMAWQYWGKKIKKFEDHQEPFDILPCSGAEYGKGMYGKYFELEKPDALVTLGDAWMVAEAGLPPRAFPWIGYFPLDGDPLSRQIHQIVSRMDVRVAMSYFGKHVLETAGLNCNYVPHGVDPSIYKPLPEEEKLFLKSQMGWEDKFVFGMVARPNPRKHFERLFRAYGNMLEKNERARKETGLYLHMDMTDPMCPQNFRELLNIHGIEENVAITNHPYLSGVPPKRVNEIYNMFDVNLLSTGGEGFGLTQIEAGAAGIPTLATNYTTPPEIQRGGTAGILIPTEKLDMEAMGVRKGWIDIKLLEQSLNFIFENPEILKKYKTELEKVIPYYHFEKVVPRMEELIFASVGNVQMTYYKQEEKEEDVSE